MKKVAYSLALVLLLTTPAMGDDAPQEVEIDMLSQLYEPVQFDHAMHVEMVDDNCAVCHHHATGMAPVTTRCLKCHEADHPADTVACSDCHSASRFSSAYLKEIENNPYRYHRDVVGLKGAFHHLCLGCHKQQEAPVGCQDCHVRTEAGDKEFHAGSYAPQESSAGNHH